MSITSETFGKQSCVTLPKVVLKTHGQRVLAFNRKGKEVMKYEGHSGSVAAIAVHKGVLYSSSGKELFAWNLHSGVRNLAFPVTSRVTSFAIVNGRIFSNHKADNIVREWTPGGKLVHEFHGKPQGDEKDDDGDDYWDGKSPSISCYIVHGGYLYLGCSEGTVIVYDISSKKRVTAMRVSPNVEECDFLLAHERKLYVSVPNYNKDEYEIVVFEPLSGNKPVSSFLLPVLPEWRGYAEQLELFFSYGEDQLDFFRHEPGSMRIKGFHTIDLKAAVHIDDHNYFGAAKVHQSASAIFIQTNLGVHKLDLQDFSVTVVDTMTQTKDDESFRDIHLETGKKQWIHIDQADCLDNVVCRSLPLLANTYSIEKCVPLSTSVDKDIENLKFDHARGILYGHTRYYVHAYDVKKHEQIGQLVGIESSIDTYCFDSSFTRCYVAENMTLTKDAELEKGQLKVYNLTAMAPSQTFEQAVDVSKMVSAGDSKLTLLNDRMLVLCSSHQSSGDFLALVYDVDTMTVVKTLMTSAEVSTVPCFQSNPPRLVLGSLGKFVGWNLEGESSEMAPFDIEFPAVDHEGEYEEDKFVVANHYMFAPSQRIVGEGCEYGTAVHVYDLDTQSPVGTLQPNVGEHGYCDELWAHVIESEIHVFICTSMGALTKLSHFVFSEDGSDLRWELDVSGRVKSFVPDEKYHEFVLRCTTEYGVFNLRTGKKVGTFEDHVDSLQSVAMSASRKELYSSSTMVVSRNMSHWKKLRVHTKRVFGSERNLYDRVNGAYGNVISYALEVFFLVLAAFQMIAFAFDPTIGWKLDVGSSLDLWMTLVFGYALTLVSSFGLLTTLGLPFMTAGTGSLALSLPFGSFIGFGLADGWLGDAFGWLLSLGLSDVLGFVGAFVLVLFLVLNFFFVFYFLQEKTEERAFLTRKGSAKLTHLAVVAVIGAYAKLLFIPLFRTFMAAFDCTRLEDGHYYLDVTLEGQNANVDSTLRNQTVTLNDSLEKYGVTQTSMRCFEGPHITLMGIAFLFGGFYFITCVRFWAAGANMNNIDVLKNPFNWKRDTAAMRPVVHPLSSHQASIRHGLITIVLRMILVAVSVIMTSNAIALVCTQMGAGAILAVTSVRHHPFAVLKSNRARGALDYGTLSAYGVAGVLVLSDLHPQDVSTAFPLIFLVACGVGYLQMRWLTALEQTAEDARARRKIADAQVVARADHEKAKNEKFSTDNDSDAGDKKGSRVESDSHDEHDLELGLGDSLDSS